jgi:hypothetical protein
MPLIELVEPVYDELAELVPSTNLVYFLLLRPTVPIHQERLAKIHDLSIRTRAPCPETICGILLKKTIRMSRVTDHFIFTVESVGMYSPLSWWPVLRILQQSVSHGRSIRRHESIKSSLPVERIITYAYIVGGCAKSAYLQRKLRMYVDLHRGHTVDSNG